MAKINSINNKSGELTVDPGASGDSFIQFDINGTGEFRIGVDDTDDSFRISQGSALGTNDTFIMTDDGERTLPLQPSFCALLSSQSSNATGDNTTFTVVFDTEIWDLNSDYNTGTGQFTAPIAGKYLFTANITLTDIAATHEDLFFHIKASNRLMRGFSYHNGSGTGIFTSEGTSCACAILDMDASDVAYVDIRISGGTKVVNVYSSGSTDLYTSFQGCLLV